MSKHDPKHFDPNCEGCRPCIADPLTLKPLPKDHPVVIAANDVWDELPYEKQEALHRIWVKNSRRRGDMEIAQEFSDLLKQRLEN